MEGTSQVAKDLYSETFQEPEPKQSLVGSLAWPVGVITPFHPKTTFVLLKVSLDHFKRNLDSLGTRRLENVGSGGGAFPPIHGYSVLCTD